MTCSSRRRHRWKMIKAVGKLFRLENPLRLNCKHVPMGYHGRVDAQRERTELPASMGQVDGAGRGDA